MKKWICAILAGLLLVSGTVGVVAEPAAEPQAGQEQTDGTASSTGQETEAGGESGETSTDSEGTSADSEGTSADAAVSTSYRDYMEQYADAARPDTEIEVDTGAATVPEGTAAQWRENQDGSQTALLIPDGGQATFPVTVSEAGLYVLRVTYQPVPGKEIDITCSLSIDGVQPFTSAAGIGFTRVWKNSGEASFSDAQGNEYHPVQEEEYRWEEAYVSAQDEYMDSGYSFYFSEGEHTLTIESVQEGILIGGITLCQEPEVPTYEEYLQERSEQPAAMDAEPIVLEGEDAQYKSHSTLYGIADYSSPINSPYDVYKSLLNTVGGENWAGKGQWLEWEFEVEQEGYYQLVFRHKQNYKSGSYSVRRLTLDGEVPFTQAASIRFNYQLGWDVMALGGEEPMYIYLTEGSHTLRLEAVYGDFASVCQEIQELVDELNVMYRQIVMITGASPDTLRDYNLGGVLPDLQSNCTQYSERLYAVLDELVSMTGGKGSETAVIEKTAIQLEEFAEDVEMIPQRLSAFNSNISALASWLSTAAQQPLLLDYLQFAPVGSELPQADAPWYRSVANEVMRFLLSFFEDYDNIQTTAETSEEPVTLWLGVGRDQATAMQSIITNNFSAQTGIPVNVRLIAMDVLMRAVASGAGPDLALYQDQATAINYALRNAAYDLTQFEDIDEVLEQFPYETTVPFRLGDGLYALPENINFNVMFYRTDILAELGLEVPQTWDELYDALAVLQKNNMEVGIISSFTTTTTTTMNSLFLTFLYQYGGEVYDEEGKVCILDDPIGVQAFTDFCELYTTHGLSLKVDLLTRFRTGETPIAINNFSFANELAVSAPEISGLWEMAVLPGTVKEDGTIDNSTVVTSSGTVMFSNARNKENTWEFMKWWTSREGQVEYARAIETTLGRSGRWTSANVEAIDSVAWSKDQLAVIKEQLNSVRGLPEVAGGYYTGRSVNNAIHSVVSSNTEPKETLYEYVRDINKEIQQKRRELGLDE